MQQVRFYTFSQMIDSIHKSIGKIKTDLVPHFGVKSVYMFWIYQLYEHPDGLSAAELAEKAMISRSLVSREIEELVKGGYVELHETARGKRKNYNARMTLTEKGLSLAEHIKHEALQIQGLANEGISPEELEAFYMTLEKLRNNLQRIEERTDQVMKADPSAKNDAKSTDHGDESQKTH